MFHLLPKLLNRFPEVEMAVVFVEVGGLHTQLIPPIDLLPIHFILLRLRIRLQQISPVIIRLVTGLVRESGVARFPRFLDSRFMRFHSFGVLVC